MSYIDAVVVVVLAGAAWSGYRRGFLATTFALIGALGGTIVALRLAPLGMAHVDQPAAKIAVGIACIVAGIGMGEVAGSTVGRALSERITFLPGRTADRALGLIGHTFAVLVITWMVALPFASAPYPALASAVRSSAILTGVDKVMPASIRSLSDQMRRLLDDSGFPAILAPLATTPDTPVQEPDPASIRAAPVVAAARSVVKIHGRAESCARSIEGSGFVFAGGRVLTNAHVVAGTTTVEVEADGAELPASVVVYDPEEDLAVLTVKGLDRPALTFAAAAAKTGDVAVAAGYPLDGPYRATAARVSTAIHLRGPDIYNTDTVTRGVFSIRATIQSGNSGGPLLDVHGRVIGVIFGASLDKPEVGFALSAAEVARTVASGRADDSAASTGSCTPD